jgi:hypothetical protein
VFWHYMVTFPAKSSRDIRCGIPRLRSLLNLAENPKSVTISGKTFIIVEIDSLFDFVHFSRNETK